MTISSVSGSIILADNTSITGNLDVTGNVTIGGDITIGDADTDSIQFTGDIDSNVTPNITATYNLGSVTKRWNHVYANELDLDNINITGNRITTTASNSDLELRSFDSDEFQYPVTTLQLAEQHSLIPLQHLLEM